MLSKLFALLNRFVVAQEKNAYYQQKIADKLDSLSYQAERWNDLVYENLYKFEDSQEKTAASLESVAKTVEKSFSVENAVSDKDNKIQALYLLAKELNNKH
jgi:alkyl sulfatase BDS1-like metallo-beta-lactamase superfamily hydrolase